GDPRALRVIDRDNGVEGLQVIVDVVEPRPSARSLWVGLGAPWPVLGLFQEAVLLLLFLELELILRNLLDAGAAGSQSNQCRRQNEQQFIQDAHPRCTSILPLI